MGFKMVVKKVICGAVRSRARRRGNQCAAAGDVLCHCSGGDALGCGKRRWMLREEAVDAVGGERERGPAGAPGAASPRVPVSVRPGRLSHRPGISS